MLAKRSENSGGDPEAEELSGRKLCSSLMVETIFRFAVIAHRSSPQGVFGRRADR